MWGWLRPRRVPEEAAVPCGFDAVISLGPYNLPAGVSPGRAVPAVRQAVAALPGAGWISVEHHPGPSGTGAVAVTPMGTGDCGDAQARVEAAVARVLAGLGHGREGDRGGDRGGYRGGGAAAAAALPAAAADAWPVVATATPAGGLAEPPVAALDALAALESLAAAVRRPEPAAPGLGNAGPGDAGPVIAEADAANGLERLDDGALLTTLLGLALPEAAAGPAARRALARFGSYAAVLSQPAAALLALPGVGPHAAAAIKLAHEAALRCTRAAALDPSAPVPFEALLRHLTAVLAREPLEHFRVVFLDGAGRVRADEAQARGTVNHTPVYPREVARRALELGAASVILVHNHPSGDPTPSGDDHAMTAAVRDACGAVGVAVEDHLIIGNGRWFSFRREGCLPHGTGRAPFGAETDR